MATEAALAFLGAPLLRVSVGSADIAYRRIGRGSPLLLIHGWPLSGFTWRHVVQRLASRFDCIIPDSPGAGDTRCRRDHDFRFRGQAEAYARFLHAIAVDKVDILAHDTGATIARELSLIVGPRVDKLVMINTEIPNHRPPFIPMYQRLTSLPGAAVPLRLMMGSRMYRRSKMGFGGCFCDMSLIDGEFHDQFVAPLVASSERMQGQIDYLRGIDWTLVDGLASRHREIAAHTLFIWGEDDPTFPIERGREMVGQLARCAGLRPVAGAKLLVHEEKPDSVVEHALELLG